jgi:cytoskeletal protein RodZ
MQEFKKSKIVSNNENISKIISKARQEAQISLEKASKQTKINIEYLRALEEGKFNKLPTGLYAQSYIKEYAEYLGLNPDFLLGLFQEMHAQDKSGDLFVKNAHKLHKFISLPKIFQNIFISLLVLLIFSYLIFYLNNITKEPDLIITNPKKDITVKELIIEVKGKTEKEAEIFINGEPILADISGYFSQFVNLKKGINTITVSAKKKYSRTNIISRKVIVEE